MKIVLVALHFTAYAYPTDTGLVVREITHISFDQDPETFCRIYEDRQSQLKKQIIKA